MRQQLSIFWLTIDLLLCNASNETGTNRQRGGSDVGKLRDNPTYVEYMNNVEHNLKYRANRTPDGNGIGGTQRDNNIDDDTKIGNNIKSGKARNIPKSTKRNQVPIPPPMPDSSTALRGSGIASPEMQASNTNTAISNGTAASNDNGNTTQASQGQGDDDGASQGQGDDDASQGQGDEDVASTAAGNPASQDPTASKNGSGKESKPIWFLRILRDKRVLIILFGLSALIIVLLFACILRRIK